MYVEGESNLSPKSMAFGYDVTQQLLVHHRWWVMPRYFIYVAFASKDGAEDSSYREH